MPDTLQGALAGSIEAELTAEQDDYSRPFRPSPRPYKGEAASRPPPGAENLRGDLMQIAVMAKENAQAIRTIAEALGIEAVPDGPGSPVKDASKNVSLRDIMGPLNEFVVDAKAVLDRINRAL